ncbi:MAG TPA: hypothetical protein VKR82_09245 [Candidatus Acidoferrales bacterium]|nr:hypothetical protein [Candidatus Acidoferrales bacterium]
MKDDFLKIKDEYLWDPKSAAAIRDPDITEIAALERSLTRFRAPGAESLPLPEAVWVDRGWQTARPSTWRESLAIAAVLVLAVGGVWLSLGRKYIGDGTGWQGARIAGQPNVDSEPVAAKFRLRTGQILETDDASRARIDVGNIGEVEVGTDSQVRLLEAQAESGSLGLEHGTITALIWAPPRRFTVRMATATAVDLGCEYTLHVDADGNGWMRVSIGWVAFEKDGQESFVPVDAMALIRQGARPGTPFYEDASPAFRSALEEIDFGAVGPSEVEERKTALATLLEQARKRDAITLWHLLGRTDGTELAQVYDDLAKLVPPPSGVTRNGILAGDRHMRDTWWDALGLRDTGWWRGWKRDFPGR